MKYRVSGMIAALMLMSSSVMAFHDSDGHWAKKYIDYLSEQEIINGYLDGSFRPDNQITREEASSIISSYIEKKSLPLSENSEKSAVKFIDMDSERWSYSSVDRLVKTETADGYPDGSFRPEDSITRAEFSKIAYSVLNKAGMLEEKKAEFSDISEHWGKEFIEILAGNGYLKGYEDGDFRPDEFITRAEASKIIAAAANPELEYDGEASGKEEKPEDNSSSEDEEKNAASIKAEAAYAKQERNSIAMIAAGVSKEDGTVLNSENTLAYMESIESGHRLYFTVANNEAGNEYYLYFNEKYLNPGETYKVYIEENGNSAPVTSESFYQNTVLGKVAEVDGHICYIRDMTQNESLTIKNMLKKSIEPLGRTLYVWGGGWNEEDTAAGPDALTVGASPRWEEFFNMYGSGYNYNNTRYQIRDGLDCSGYIGWLMYNVFNTENNKDGYVMHADKMAKNYSDRGWGTFIPKNSVSDYKAGDIMSSPDHVYMVIGTASDGSVVLIHASPSGVKLSGTPSPGGTQYSEAAKLSQYYMETYRPAFYNKYPSPTVNSYYLRAFEQMRWDTSENGILSDPEGIQNMSAEEVLNIMFNEE